MRTIALPDMRGLDVSVSITHGINTASAYGLTLDENADVVAETDTRRFSGFCDRCIAYDIAGDMIATRRRIEHSDISDALDEIELECRCD